MSNSSEIGAFYQCYKQPKAFLHAINSYRHYYPDGDLIVVSDGGYNYSHIVSELKGNYVHEEQTGNGVMLQFNTIEKASTFIRRFLAASKKISQDYFILLEDDVVIFDRVSDSTKVADVVGCNRTGTFRSYRMKDAEGMHSNLKKYCKIDNPSVGGCGGSLFRTDFFKNLEFNVDEVLAEYSEYDPDFYSDILLSYITWRFGGSIIGPVPELGETNIMSWDSMVKNGEIKVLHQSKWNYDKPLTEEEKKMLGNDNIV
jgi:hypothetical protein